MTKYKNVTEMFQFYQQKKNIYFGSEKKGHMYQMYHTTLLKQDRYIGKDLHNGKSWGLLSSSRLLMIGKSLENFPLVCFSL